MLQMNTNDLFRIPMEVKPHIKKYLQTLYGPEYTISKTDNFGKMIMLMLTRDINNVWEAEKLDSYVRYTIAVPFGAWHNEGFKINSKNRLFFNEIADQYFREKMYDFTILQNIMHNRKYRDSIRRYLKLYRITEDDISYETIYRDFNRKKDAIINEKTTLSYFNI